MGHQYGLNICNLMPHEIIVFTEDGEKVFIPSSGYVSRCSVHTRKSGNILLNVDGVDKLFGTVEQVFEHPQLRKIGGKEVLKFPDPIKDHVFIASTMVARALRRPDVLSPDTTVRSAIRGDTGHIVAVSRLQTFSVEDTT